MGTYHIHLEGQVQGVGFRPFVYQSARAAGLCGTVSNGMDGVHIYFNAAPKMAGHFFQFIQDNLPLNARVLSSRIEEVDQLDFSGFSIVKTEEKGAASLLLTPDLGLCPQCKAEVHDPASRYHRYAFNSCIHCGPRYSIVEALPYDRERTTMQGYGMCIPCRERYDSPLTRRHFSQTNSCPDCGVRMRLLERRGRKWKRWEEKEKDLIRYAVDLLAAGKIMAIKGIGGYLLMCDATHPQVVGLLRARKQRPAKPFALMYPDLPMLKSDAQVSSKAAEAFLSIQSPIVICPLRKQPESGIDTEGIAPGLGQIGAMQPYTPLFELLLHRFRKPVVATSGNISGSPIFYRDESALEHLGPLVDAFLMNDREITIPQDDSVIRFTPDGEKRIFLRRSRAWAPTYVHDNFPRWEASRSVLAMGAELKSSFALQHQGNTYLSQYLGALESFETQERFRSTLHHLQNLLGAKPESVLIDSHPGYFASTLGRELAAQWDIPVMDIPHHEAHFAAVLAENGLLNSRDPVLGIIWDGTGWGASPGPTGGHPGEIWGGEFFRFEDQKIKRLGHFDFYPLLLGDKMAKEPRLSALALSGGVPGADAFLRPLFSSAEWRFYQKLLRQSPRWVTSSAGRLFDGVAALLGLCTHNSYEGEAAMRLEELAGQYSGPVSWRIPNEINLPKIIHQLLEGLHAGADRAKLAYQFHDLLIQWIGQIARRQQIHRLAFSGGVWQNALLTQLAIRQLTGEFELFFHRELSSNDENIALGQLAHAYLQEEKKPDELFSKTKNKKSLCV